MKNQIELDGRLSPGAIFVLERMNQGTDKEDFDFGSIRLPLGIGEANDSQRAMVSEFHERYLAQTSSRQRLLGQLYLELNRPRDVLVMLFCRQFLPFFENWVKSCSLHGVEFKKHLIAFTLDETSENFLSELGVKSCFLDPAKYLPAGSSRQFGDQSFVQTMLYKAAIILDMLNLGPSVLYQDVDLIWLRNPFEYFRSQCSDGDAWAMCDPSHFIAPTCASLGFIYVHPTLTSKVAFESALGNSSAIPLLANYEQELLNKVFQEFRKHGAFRLEILPQHLFLNGHLFNLETGIDPKAGNWREEGVVFHYSWTANRFEKLEKLNKFGMNYTNLQASQL